jgi:fucose permease
MELDEFTTPGPENRLTPIVPAMFTFPIVLLLYSWFLEARLHGIVPTISTLFYGFSLSRRTPPIMDYLVNIFDSRSASAFGAILPLRYIAGAFMPAAASSLYNRLGYRWGNALLAFLCWL